MYIYIGMVNLSEWSLDLLAIYSYLLFKHVQKIPVLYILYYNTLLLYTLIYTFNFISIFYLYLHTEILYNQMTNVMFLSSVILSLTDSVIVNSVTIGNRVICPL